jgi:hypothetical protein
MVLIGSELSDPCEEHLPTMTTSPSLSFLVTHLPSGFVYKKTLLSKTVYGKYERKCGARISVGISGVISLVISAL